MELRTWVEDFDKTIHIHFTYSDLELMDVELTPLEREMLGTPPVTIADVLLDAELIARRILEVEKRKILT